MGMLRRSGLPSVDRLLQIAGEIRAIPAAFRNLPPDDAMEQGTRLLREARELGAFTSPEHSGLRLLLDRIRSRTQRAEERGLLHSDAGFDYAEWIEAADQLCRDIQEEIVRNGGSPLSHWNSAECFSRIASVVEAEAHRLTGDGDEITSISEKAGIVSPENSSPAPSDGPVPPDAFLYNGKRFGGLPPTAWRLIRELWSASGRTREIDFLADPVWRDHALYPDENQVGDVRKAANSFFKANELPFRVSKKGQFLTLKTLPTRGSAISP
jgi:hypothetical protein